MELRALGNSGLLVSKISLGTMTWGRDTDVHEARDQFNIYYAAGGRFIDTADVYSDGVSEEIVGEFVRDHPEVVISSKAGSVRTARKRDASRAHLLDALDNSLRRLRRTHIDVWHMHAWDPYTPIDETLAAADSAISSGKVRYLGISNYSGWQLTQAATLQQVGSAYPIVSAQMEYSLLQRGIEREVVPAAASLGIGIMAWSPLGRGVLTGKYRHGTPADSRGATSHFASFVTTYFDDKSRAIVEAVCTAAEGLGLHPIDVALAWLAHRPQISSLVIGARTAAQLRVVLNAVDISVPIEILDALTSVSELDRGYPDFGWNQQ
jgi:aryl-alcohol dehydrogenase-like predicted oxidoreductase